MKINLQKILFTKVSYLFVLVFSSSVSITIFANDGQDRVFNPKIEVEDTSLLTAGTVINKENIATYKAWLDEGLYQQINLGELDITLGENIQFPVHPNYRKATHENRDKTKLIDKKITNYINGRPFPSPLSTNDPEAGLKAAWNMRYAYSPDEVETEIFNWEYKDMDSGDIERRIEMYGAILKYSHRHSIEPIPNLETNPAELFSALYLRVDYPASIRGTQLLIHRKEDDASQEQAWMYLNTQRRVRRLATRQKTDAFLGSDIMIEDFLGYNGRIMDMQWKFIRSDLRFLPMYAHNQLLKTTDTSDQDFKLINFSGQGGCFPDVTWQLRHVYIVDAIPVDTSHPLSKRRYVLDAATFAPAFGKIYDKGGQLWKLAMVALSDSSQHLIANETWQGVVNDGVSMIDLQARHCTTLQFKSKISEQRLTNKLFTTQQMRATGR